MLVVASRLVLVLFLERTVHLRWTNFFNSNFGSFVPNAHNIKKFLLQVEKTKFPSIKI